MQIHAFSGFYSADMKASRSAGILAALLETYPQMTWDDVLQWAHENALDEWVPNLNTDDTQPNSVRLVGTDGFINFDDRYPWTSEAQSNFVQWANGYDIGKLPPIQTASPAIQQAFTEPVISSQPAPTPQSQPVDEWDFFQSQNQDTTLPQSAPAPAPAPTPTYTQSSAPAPATTPSINPVSYQKPEPKKEGSSNMLLIVGGIIAAYMLMKRKK